jgi:hypothetical protein
VQLPIGVSKSVGHTVRGPSQILRLPACEATIFFPDMHDQDSNGKPFPGFEYCIRALGRAILKIKLANLNILQSVVDCSVGRALSFSREGPRFKSR